MKQLLTISFLLLNTMIHGQTEGRKLLAHYPLTEHFGDVTGQEDSLETSNVEITEEGLYIDGADRASDTANIIMAQIEALNLDDFYISLEVKIDSLVGEAADQFIRYVFVGGLGTEWMHIILNQRFSNLFLGRIGPGGGITSTKYEANRWYRFGLSYDRSTKKGLFYIDGEVAIADSFELAGEENKVLGLGRSDRRVPMKGHWKNLQVYGEKESGVFPLSINCNEKITPSNSINSDGSIALEIFGGTPPYQVSWNSGDTLLNKEGTYIFSDLVVGIYHIQVIDSLNMMDSCETILVSAEGPLAGRKLLAHYPLQSDFEDVSGQEDTLQTANVEITSEGLYFDGADPFSDSANLARVWINELDLDDYYISFEVKIDSVVNDGIQSINLRNIFTGGMAWRWMRAIVNQQFGFITMLRSGGSANITLPYETDRWYTMGLYYNRKNLEGRFYLDGELVIRDSFDLLGNNDKFIGIGCNCGPWPFKGHWKNLMVYGPDNRSIPLSLTCSESQLPSNESASDGSISITIEGGFAPYQVSWNGSDTTFAEVGTYEIPNLGLGTHNFEILDSSQVRQSCETVLQIPGQLPLIAYYPLQGDLQDELMQNNDLQIANVEIRDSALYIDGAENFTDTSNFILIPRINSLNHDEFEIRLQFYVDSIGIPEVTQRRTIILAGQSFRWATLYYYNDTKEFQLGYNNSESSPKRIPMEFNRWYEMSITYDRSIRTLSLFIDGIKVESVEADLITSVDKSIALNCCNRAPMKGFWRNLRVYSSEKVINPSIALHQQTLEWNGTSSSTDGAIQVSITGGDGPFTAELFSNETQVDSQQVFGRELQFENLAVGSYEVSVTDRFDSVEIMNFELLPPQTDLPILSYYPMKFDLADTSGIHNSLALNQTEHIFGEGIHLPGNENDTSGIDQVSTFLSELNTDDFYISMNVTIDSIAGLLGGDRRSIFIGGQFWRWMYPYYSQSSQEIGLTYNNFGKAPGKIHFDYNREYEIAVAYNRNSQTGKLFVDRVEVTRDTFDMETSNDLSFGLNCYCGPQPMKGLWRNLRIYSAQLDTTSTSNREIYSEEFINIYPNPSSSHITIELLDRSKLESILWYDAIGRLVQKTENENADSILNIPVAHLDPGIYWIRIGNTLKKFIKI